MFYNIFNECIQVDMSTQQRKGHTQSKTLNTSTSAQPTNTHMHTHTHTHTHMHRSVHHHLLLSQLPTSLTSQSGFHTDSLPHALTKEQPAPPKRKQSIKDKPVAQEHRRHTGCLPPWHHTWLCLVTGSDTHWSCRKRKRNDEKIHK